MMSVVCFAPNILGCIASFFNCLILGRMIIAWSRFLYQIYTREMLQYKSRRNEIRGKRQ